jgi:membrane protease YdiL (CAAX protease family)
MNHTNAPRGKIGQLLTTNRFAILLEIIIVFLPLFLGLQLNERLGSDHITIIGDIVILQGWITYAGLIISLVLLWVASWLRGANWGYFGVERPEKWWRVILVILGVSLAVFLVVRFAINPIINVVPNFEPPDLSRFNYITGNLPNLIIQLVNVWITAAFLEELLFRGYLMTRLTDLQGKQTKLAWTIALIGSAIIFGLVHFEQGLAGMIKISVIGLVFGIGYLSGKKNLWPLVIAHGIIDSIDMVSHYYGG